METRSDQIAGFGTSPLLERHADRPLGAPLLLHRGDLTRQLGERPTLDGFGEIRLEFSPGTAIVAEFGTADRQALMEYAYDDEDDLEVRFDPVSPTVLAPGDAVRPDDSKGVGLPSERVPHAIDVGGGPLTTLWLHLVNMKSGLHNGQWLDASVMKLVGGGWQIDVRPVESARAVDSYLRQSGGYEITHTAKAQREDLSPFTVNEAEELVHALHWFLGFVNGAHVGIAVPVGLDTTGTPSWTRWQVSNTGRWTSLPAWPGFRASDPIVSAWPGFITTWSRSEEHEQVLRRAIGSSIAAKRPDPVDLAPVGAALTLELLGWFVLYVEERWLVNHSNSRVVAADRLRLLLRWAGVPITLPHALADGAMAEFATGGDGNVADGPDALYRVRNRIVHPEPGNPKKPAPSGPAMIDAWRLGALYTDLVMLRLIGYAGEHVDGFDRWGTLRPVPWSVSETVTDW